MLCESCHEKEATVHLTQKSPGESDRQRHLCSECFPAGGSDADQVRAISKQFGMNLPPDVEIRSKNRPS
jgi:protein-arginine kinase activator protein McsA